MADKEHAMGPKRIVGAIGKTLFEESDVCCSPLCLRYDALSQTLAIVRTSNKSCGHHQCWWMLSRTLCTRSMRKALCSVIEISQESFTALASSALWSYLSLAAHTLEEDCQLSMDFPKQYNSKPAPFGGLDLLARCITISDATVVFHKRTCCNPFRGPALINKCLYVSF